MTPPEGVSAGDAPSESFQFIFFSLPLATLATDCLGSDPQTFRKNRLRHRLTWIRGENAENVVEQTQDIPITL